MRLFSIYRVELRRLLLSKMIWAVTVLCMLAPLLGYSLYIVSSQSVMSGRYIANPVLAGTTVGGILWALVTILESDRLHRNGTDILTDAVASPVSLCAARMSAALTISAVVTLIVSLVYLPFTAEKMDYLFSAEFYFANFFVFMLLTWWISILLADAFYQITRRNEISFILYAVMAYFSFSGFVSSDYFMGWLNPYVVTYSDGFPSYWPLRIGLYTRLIWLFIALGLWLLSVLCIRRYQLNLVYSLVRGLKKVHILLPAAVMIISGSLLWHYQSFIDHGPDEYDHEYTDRTYAPSKMFNAVRYNIKTDPVSGKIYARAEYDVGIPYSEEAVLRLNPGYEITAMTYGGEVVPFRTVDDDVNGERPTYFTLPKVSMKTLVIEYEGMPTVAKFQAKFQVPGSVDRSYITLGGKMLFPFMENYSSVNDASLAITIPDDLTPFLNYELMTEYVDNGDGTKTWTAECPLYVMDFTAGNYVIDTIYADDLQIDFAYGEAYKTIVEESDARQAVIDVFRYCGEHYGELVWAEDKRMLLQQRSAMLMGGYALPGVSQWFENVLSPDTLSDSNKGNDATDVFIHEMVHQWWGGLGLNCADEELWSEEGLTVYSTYRIIKEKYGELYAQQYCIDMWRNAVDIQNRNFYNRHPEYLELLPESYQAMLNVSNNSTNKYMRMPLMILKAEELVGGEEKMDEILRRMYSDREKFAVDHPFGFQDFLDYCGLTEEDLSLE